jgi:hypothetical protein
MGQVQCVMSIPSRSSPKLLTNAPDPYPMSNNQYPITRTE